MHFQKPRGARGWVRETSDDPCGEIAKPRFGRVLSSGHPQQRATPSLALVLWAPPSFSSAGRLVGQHLPALLLRPAALRVRDQAGLPSDEGLQLPVAVHLKPGISERGSRALRKWGVVSLTKLQRGSGSLFDFPKSSSNGAIHESTSGVLGLCLLSFKGDEYFAEVRLSCRQTHFVVKHNADSIQLNVV